MPDQENQNNVLQQGGVGATTDNWFTLDESNDIRSDRKPRGNRKKQREGRHLQRARAHQHTLATSLNGLADELSHGVQMAVSPHIGADNEATKKHRRPSPIERTRKLLSEIYERSGLEATAVLVFLDSKFKPVASPLPTTSADSLIASATATNGPTSTFAQAEAYTSGILKQLEYYSKHLGRTHAYHEKIMADESFISPVLINQVTYGRMVLSVVVGALTRRYQEALVQVLLLDREKKLRSRQISDILGPFWTGHNLDPEPMHNWPWLTDDVMRRYWYLMRRTQ